MKPQHWLLMIVGCVLPVIFLAVASILLGGVSSLLLLALVLLCPAAHLLLIRNHFGPGHPGPDDIGK
jgi:hypothetical protein